MEISPLARIPIGADSAPIDALRMAIRTPFSKSMFIEDLLPCISIDKLQL